MEIRTLKYFLAVAREGSFTGAAKFLHLSQPILSRQLKEFEENLGVKLFLRHSHNVSLTQHDIRLRKRAGEILDMLEKTRDEFTDADTKIGGDIYIGAGESKAMRQLGNIVSPMLRLNPLIRVHIHSGNKDDISDRLDKGLLDFGVLLQPANLSKYDYVGLPEKEVWGVLLRKDHPLSAKQALKKEDLFGEPLLLSRQAICEGSGENRFMEWFKGDFDRMKIAAHCGQWPIWSRQGTGIRQIRADHGGAWFYHHGL